MEDFYGKKFRKIETIEKNVHDFLFFFFSNFFGFKKFLLGVLFFNNQFFRKYFCDFVSIFRGSRASAASRPPEASHQPPKAASVRVFVEKLSLKGKRSSLRSRTYKNETFFSFCYIVYKIEL